MMKRELFSKIAGKTIGVFVCFFILTSGFNIHVKAQAPARVLYISSYSYSFDSVPGQINGIKSILDEEYVNYDLEFMDTKRFNSSVNYENYYDFLYHRLSSIKPYDVIIVGDDNALQFLMDNEEHLVKDVPVVFLGINDMNRLLEAEKRDNYTGIYEQMSIEENVELAKRLQPNLREIIAIYDNTRTGIGEYNDFMAVSDKYPELVFSGINYSELSETEFEQRLSSLEDTQALMYLSMMENYMKQVITVDEAVHNILSATDAIVYTPTIGGEGKGLLGGYSVSYFEHGRLAAQMAMDIIGGKKVEDIAIIKESPNQYIIDYNVLVRHGLDLERLPKETVLIHAPEPFIESIRWLLIPALVVGVVMMMLSALMFVDNRRKHLAAIDLQEKNDELTGLYEELTAQEEELRAQYEELEDHRKALMRSRKKYKELAYTDMLTGLNNRAYLYEVLEREFQKDTKTGYLFFIDLDNFKYINDSFGHILGDKVLRAIGYRLQNLMDDETVVIRIGGDEFVLARFSSEEPIDHQNLLAQINDCLEDMLIIGEKEIYVTGSIGVVAFPEHGKTAEELIRKADIAMYEAKENGKGQAMYYSKFMDKNVTNLMGIQNNIRFAIERNQFELYLQPQIEAKNLGLVSFEGLIRWNMPGEGVISPGEFIPVAEQLGLIHRIGRWVYQRAFYSIERLEQELGITVKVAMNVSAMEITRPHFAREFFELIQSHHMQPNKLIIELTESVFLEAAERHIDTLKGLQNIGVEIHLDDFGTGYSSLNYLRLLPVDVVKIDRDFIQDITINEKQADLTQSLISIIHNLGKTVVAEGVETQEQLHLLQTMGCDVIQGYYFAKPMPLDEAIKFAKEHHQVKFSNFD